MAKREDDGTVSLHTANQFAKKCDAEAAKQRDGLEKAAHQAVRAAFRNPLAQGPERREQKNLR